jgi:hypothetical protein
VRRLFWLGLGATAGVLVARTLRQTASQLTPDTLVAKALDTARDFWVDVRAFAEEREAELRTSFGLDET